MDHCARTINKVSSIAISDLLAENERLRERVEALERAASEGGEAVSSTWESDLNSRIWLENSPIFTKIVDLDRHLQ
jgi:hypothetical protein